MRKSIFAISFAVLIGVCAVTVLRRPVQIDSTVSHEVHPPIAQQPVIVHQPEGEAMPSDSQTAMAKIYETHEKVINYSVSFPVYDTHTKELSYTVMKPVTETLTKEVPYTVLRTITELHPNSENAEIKDRIIRTVKHIPETKMKLISYTVTKVVPEQRTKTVTYTSCRMVTEARHKTVQYTTCREVPALTLQIELEQDNENAKDPMGSNRCLN